MTKYKVLKPMPRAKVGDVLETGNKYGDLYKENEIGTQATVIDWRTFKDALSEGFIEEIKEEGRWRAEKGEKYWLVDKCSVEFTRWDDHEAHDIHCYDTGNYFKSRETAQLVAEAQKLMYEYLHDAKTTGIYNSLINALYEAHKAVIKDDRSTS